MTLDDDLSPETTAAAGADHESPAHTFTYLCIGCPLGCRMELDEDESGNVVEVRGSSCKRGDRYALQEHTDPRRMVTTTVALDGGRWPRVAVKTDGEVPRGQVLEVCRALGRVKVTAPVHIGDVVARDILGSGCDVVATAEMPAQNGPY